MVKPAQNVVLQAPHPHYGWRGRVHPRVGHLTRACTVVDDTGVYVSRCSGRLTRANIRVSTRGVIHGWLHGVYTGGYTSEISCCQQNNKLEPYGVLHGVRSSARLLHGPLHGPLHGHYTGQDTGNYMGTTRVRTHVLVNVFVQSVFCCQHNN